MSEDLDSHGLSPRYQVEGRRAQRAEAGPQCERRSAQLEIRANPEQRRLKGYVATFGTEADLGSFVEAIAPGAFSRSLSRDVLGLVDHDYSKVLGRSKAGTLRLNEDDKGLAFELDLPNTTLATDLLENVRVGNVGGMSFAFETIKEQWRGKHRLLRDVLLHEVSVVQSFPAYEGTVVSIAARNRIPGKPSSKLLFAQRKIDLLRISGRR